MSVSVKNLSCSQSGIQIISNISFSIKNGEILIGSGFDITEEQLEKIINQKEKIIDLVNIDLVYIRKNIHNADIYRKVKNKN